MMTSDSEYSYHANHGIMIKSTKTTVPGHAPALNHLDHDQRERSNFIRRRLSFRRRKIPTVRLGGRRRRGFFFRRVVKMRSLKLKLCGMIKKIKTYCRNLAKDMFEAVGTMDSIIQDTILFETAFAIPVMSLPTVNHRRA